VAAQLAASQEGLSSMELVNNNNNNNNNMYLKGIRMYLTYILIEYNNKI
jgi:hypothetical protein